MRRGPSLRFVSLLAVAGVAMGSIARATPVVSSAFVIDDRLSGVRARSEPAVAYGAGVFAAVWTDAPGMLRLDTDVQGAIIDPRTMPPSLLASFTIAGTLESESNPDVAFDGMRFVVVYRSNPAIGGTSLWARSLLPSGVLGTGASWSPGGGEPWPAVACDGAGQCLVVWHYANALSPTNPSDIGSQRVAFSAGGVTLSGLASLTIPAAQFHPSVAFAGSGYQIAWSDASPGPNRTVTGATAAVGGSPGPAAPLAMAVGTQDFPSVGSSPSGSIVAWQQMPAANQIFYRLISTAGTPIGGNVALPPSPAPAAQSAPSASFDGAEFRVVWEDFAPGAPAVAGAEVTAGGLFTPFAVTVGSDTGHSPDIASDGARHSLVVYARGGGIEGRLVSPDPAGMSCGADAMCGGRRCLGGFCCATICPAPTSCQIAVCAAGSGACSFVTDPACGPDGGAIDASTQADVIAADAPGEVASVDGAAMDAMQDSQSEDVHDASPAPDAQSVDTDPAARTGPRFHGSGCACHGAPARESHSALRGLLFAICALGVVRVRSRRRTRIAGLCVTLCVLTFARPASAQLDAGASTASQPPPVLASAPPQGAPASAAPSVAPPTPLTPEEQRRFRPPAGTFRAEGSRDLAGVRFVPLPGDRRQGQLWLLWLRRSRGGPVFERGTYQIDRSVLRARDSRGVEVSMDVQWVGPQLRLRFGPVDALLDPVRSVCRTARDCVEQADGAPEFACSRAVQWSCAYHECRVHCGPAASTPAHVRCGPVWCPAGQVCCNPIGGTCTPPGYGCGQ